MSNNAQLIMNKRKYLGIQEGSKDCNRSSKSVDGLDWCVEYDD